MGFNLMNILIRTLLLARCLKKHEQNLFGFNGVSAMKQRGSFALIMAALILTAGHNAHSQTTFILDVSVLSESK